MKITIDEKICAKNKMSIEEFLLALMYRQIRDPIAVRDNLLKREILVRKDNKYVVTQEWSKVLDKVLAASAGEQEEERITRLATEMRKIYPEGRIIDKRTGQPTPFHFRCSTSEVSNKLKTFFKRYGNFSDEDIIDATRRYVASYRGNYQQRGFRLLKYFIWKDDAKQGPDSNYIESISPLLDFLENKESDTEVINDEDWTTKIV